MGQSRLVEKGEARPAVALEAEGGERLDGCTSASGTVVGTYLHGLFDNAPVRRALLEWAARRKGLALDDASSAPSEHDRHQAAYDRLAAALREALDVRRLYQIIGL